MFIQTNPNPHGLVVDDCSVRAISIALDESWDYVYMWLCVYGFMAGDMPGSKKVVGKFLKDRGFRRFVIPDTCPDCYTVRDFCRENQNGTFILATSSHVVAVIDGDYYDAWDSGDEVPMLVWRRESNA